MLEGFVFIAVVLGVFFTFIAWSVQRYVRKEGLIGIVTCLDIYVPVLRMTFFAILIFCGIGAAVMNDPNRALEWHERLYFFAVFAVLLYFVSVLIPATIFFTIFHFELARSQRDWRAVDSATAASALRWLNRTHYFHRAVCALRGVNLDDISCWLHDAAE